MTKKSSHHQSTKNTPQKVFSAGGRVQGRFLVFVMAVMVLFMVFSLNAAIMTAVGTDKMVGNLSNKGTIEIRPRMDYPDLTLDQETNKIIKFLRSSPVVTKVSPVADETVKSMVAPWLGDMDISAIITLPRLLSVEFIDDPMKVANLRQAVTSVSPLVTLDTHDDWVKQVQTISFYAVTFMIMICLIVFMATMAMIGMGVYSRVKIFDEEIKLLHLIGAYDSFIARQFQWQIAKVSFLAIVIGGGLGGLLFMIVMHFLTPLFGAADFSDSVYGVTLSSVTGAGVIILLLGSLVTRVTVMTNLSKMT